MLICILHRELSICWLVRASLREREREKIEKIILIETEKILNKNKKWHFQRPQNIKITKNLPTQKNSIDQKIKKYILLIFTLHRELSICWLVRASLREREKIEKIILIETEKIFYWTKTKNDIFNDRKIQKLLKIYRPKKFKLTKKSKNTFSWYSFYIES